MGNISFGMEMNKYFDTYSINICVGWGGGGLIEYYFNNDWYNSNSNSTSTAHLLCKI